jgi:hypothetical protein
MLVEKDAWRKEDHGKGSGHRATKQEQPGSIGWSDANERRSWKKHAVA